MTERLRVAMAAKPVSARRLGRLLAERFGGDAESYRRTISRWRSGESNPDPDHADFLAELFEKPAGYFKTPSSARRLTTVEAELERLSARQEELAALVAELATNQKRLAESVRRTDASLAEVRKRRSQAAPKDR